MVFGEVIDKDGTPYSADIRGVLKAYAQGLHEKSGLHAERGQRNRRFYFNGADAERRYHETGVEYVNTGGYYHSLPRSAAPLYRPQRRSATGHGLREREGPPGSSASQFEINYCYWKCGRGGPDPALQIDAARWRRAWADGEFPAQTRGGRERQRHAHQRRCRRTARTPSGIRKAKRR
jgi:hypothetical protein